MEMDPKKQEEKEERMHFERISEMAEHITRRECVTVPESLANLSLQELSLLVINLRWKVISLRAQLVSAREGLE